MGWADWLVAQELLGDPAEPGVGVFGGAFAEGAPLRRFVERLAATQCHSPELPQFLRLLTGVDLACAVSGEIVGDLATWLEHVAPPAEPAKIAQLDRSAVDMVNFGGSPLVAANAAAVVLCQYLLAKLVAQSRPGVGQVESKEGDHVGGDDQRSQRVCAAAIAYRLPDVADLLGLLAAVL